MRSSLVVLLVGTILLGIVSLLGVGQQSTILRIAHASDIVSVDPAQLALSTDRVICENIYQGLIELDQASGIVPLPYKNVLATSYEVSGDAKQITFHLRQGVLFHHGYGEMTSEDVQFSMMRQLDPAVASTVKSQYAVIDRVETPDRYTVVVYLKTAVASSFLGTLAWEHGTILSKKAVQELGDKIRTYPVGTDVYEFVEWKAREEIVLRRFADYWGEKAAIDELHFKIIPDSANWFLALEAGEIDVAPLESIGAYQLAEAIPGVKIQKAVAATEVYVLFFNFNKPIFQDKRIRRAFAYAINVPELAQNLGPQFFAFPCPYNSAVFSGTDAFWTYPYDPAYAKTLLADAGYPNGLDITIIYYVGKFMEPFALELQNYLKQIGVNVKLTTVEKAVFSKSVATMLDGNADAAVWSIGRPTTSLMGERYLTGNSANYNRYSNPEYDHAVQQAVASSAESDQEAWWKRAQMILNEDVVGLWPVEVFPAAAVRNSVEGLVMTVSSSSIIDYAGAHFVR